MGKNSIVKKETDKLKIYVTAAAYASLALAVIFMIFIKVPDAILYARSGAMKWLPFLLIFGALPYSILKSVQLFYPKNSSLIAIGALLIIGPLFGLQLNRFDHLVLERDGEIVSGTITKRFQFKPSNREPEWLIQATFEANGESIVTFPQEDEAEIYKEGDRLDVIYSGRNPEINMLYFLFSEDSD